jgi:hypothetical protein
MAKFNWDRVRIEDLDYRHKLSMEARFDIPQFVQKQKVVTARTENPPEWREDLILKADFNLHLEFYLPDEADSDDWLVIVALPNALRQFAEELKSDSVQQRVRPQITSDSGSLTCKAKFTAQLPDAFRPRDQWAGPADRKGKVEKGREHVLKFKLNHHWRISTSAKVPFKSLMETLAFLLTDRWAIESVQWMANRYLKHNLRSMNLDVNSRVE